MTRTAHWIFHSDYPIEVGAGPTGEVWKEAPGKLVRRAPKLLTEAFTVVSLRAAMEKLL